MFTWREEIKNDEENNKKCDEQIEELTKKLNELKAEKDKNNENINRKKKRKDELEKKDKKKWKKEKNYMMKNVKKEIKN